jgi:hypothetical protein
MPDEQRSSTATIILVVLVLVIVLGMIMIVACAGVGWFMLQASPRPLQPMPPQPVQKVPVPVAPQVLIRTEPETGEVAPENSELPKAEREESDDVPK